MTINRFVLVLTFIYVASISTCESRRQAKTSTRQKDETKGDQSEEKVKKVLTKLIMEQLPIERKKLKTKSQISIDSLQNDDQEIIPQRSNSQNLNSKRAKNVGQKHLRNRGRNNAKNINTRGRTSKTIPILDPQDAQAAILIPEKSNEKIEKKTSSDQGGATEKLPDLVIKQPNSINLRTKSDTTLTQQENPSPRFNIEIPSIKLDAGANLAIPMVRSGGGHINSFVNRLTKKLKKGKEHLPIPVHVPDLPDPDFNLGNAPLGDMGNNLMENLGNDLDDNLDNNYQNGNNQRENLDDNQNGHAGNRPNQHGKLNINHDAGKLNINHDAGKLNINLDKNLNNNQHGILGNNQHGILGNNQHVSLGNNQNVNLESNQNGNVENNQHGNLGNNQHGNLGTNQHGNLGNNHHKNLGGNQHSNLENNQIGNLETNQIGNLETNQIEKLETNQIEKLETNQNENLENDQNPNLENHQIANIENDPNKILKDNQNANFGVSQNLKNELNADNYGGNHQPEYRKNLKKYLANKIKNKTTSKAPQPSSSHKNISQSANQFTAEQGEGIHSANHELSHQHPQYPKIIVQNLLLPINGSSNNSKSAEAPFLRLISLLKSAVKHAGPCYKIVLPAPPKQRRERISREAPHLDSDPKKLRKWEGRLFNSMLDKEVDDFSIEH